MAILLPAAPPDIRYDTLRRGRPILSGGHADDLVFGWRGISAATNHAYAYRTQVLAHAWWPPYIGHTNLVAWTLVLQAHVWFSADVAEVQTLAEIEDGALFVAVGAASVASAGVAGIAVHTVSLPVAPGWRTVVVWLGSRAAGVDAYMRSVIIRERRLVAIDIP